MPAPSAKPDEFIRNLARCHKITDEAVRALMNAIIAGGGRMAQFSHPELGGMGQWTQGGMIMIADMFNEDLKHRVNMLCNEIAQHLTATATDHQLPGATFQFSAQHRWWPEHLGTATSAGSQNNLKYAFFKDKNRLVVAYNDRITIYDTGRHLITGFAQQQGSDESLTLTTDQGVLRSDQLKIVDR